MIDYTRDDFTKNGKTYDVVFDAVGKHSFRRCRHSLKPGGTFTETYPGFMWHVPPLSLLTRWVGDKKVALGISRFAKQDVELLKRLIEAGEYRSVVDRRYPLEDVVEAHRYVETGQNTGDVVLTWDEPDGSGRAALLLETVEDQIERDPYAPFPSGRTPRSAARRARAGTGTRRGRTDGRTPPPARGDARRRRCRGRAARS